MKKFILIFSVGVLSLQADYIWKQGRMIDFKKEPWLPMQEHYTHLLKATDDQKWLDVIENAEVITHHFAESPFIDETRFLLAKAFLSIHEYARAHDTLNQYLNFSMNPKHYEEVMEMKLELAHVFEEGELKQWVGLPGIPHWLDPRLEAVKLYDEVASAMPLSFLAEKALLGKAGMELNLKEYKQAISTSEGFIRKYPKSSLAPDAYLLIGRSYLHLIESEFLDPDMLSLAQLNVSKFIEQYPAHPKIAEMTQDLTEMKEFFASNLLQTAHYFQRVKKEKAAALYFKKIVRDYPETASAKVAQDYIKKPEPVSLVHEENPS